MSFDDPATTSELLAGSCSGNLTVLLDGLEASNCPATISRPLNDPAFGSFIIVDGVVDTTSSGANANNGSFVRENPICLASGCGGVVGLCPD
jgi:hypothetical protein